MLSELTSQETMTGYLPFQDIFESSSRQEINLSEVLERWLASIRGKHFEKQFFIILNISSVISIDSSSTIYYRFPEFTSETTIGEDFFKKLEQIKALENVSGMLNELTSEQMAIFDEAVKRRPLF